MEVSRFVDLRRMVLWARSWYASIIRTVLLRARIRIECVTAVFPVMRTPRKRGESLTPVAQKMTLFPLARSAA